MDSKSIFLLVLAGLTATALFTLLLLWLIHRIKLRFKSLKAEDQIVDELGDIQKRIGQRMMEVRKKHPGWSRRRVLRHIEGEFLPELKKFNPEAREINLEEA
ncbi:MAG: hypothetical protein LPK79_07520 [Bacteroidota bacterium]|nr:hypothetical protein [Bacteroidota bacterium]